jgi:hypothetical protein
MSLFSSLILPHIEQEILSMKPQMAQFLLEQIKSTGHDLVNWAETKLNTDLDGDGTIGGEQ